jgi:hypothetical protein
MRPSSWHPPVEPSSLEQVIIARIKRAKLFVFLRHHRHELFDDAFQEELATLYAPSLRGQPPIPPAQLALATIVQAYTGVSDDEVIEATLMDRRWQLVLDCLDTEQAPFSKRTLVAFRKRLIEAQMDRRLIEQTFTLDWERQIIRCPAEQEMPFVPGGVVHFPKETCAQCPLKEQCTTSAKGRSVSIHPDEALLIELRERQQTPQERAQLRERVAVEHTLAHVSRWQGPRARYRGLRKNLFDLRRCAVVHNLHVLARSQSLQADLQGVA